MTEREEFVPYGKEWRDELMRIKKADLINLLELSYKNGRVLESKIKALQSENERLRKEIDEMDEEYTDPCDVDGCSNQACCGGTSCRESGYWRVCSSHSANARKGGQQPKMRQSSVDREATRDERGYLPSDSELKEIS